MRKKKHGIAHVRLTLNNTIIIVTNFKGNTKTWSPSGSLGFKGSHRSTNYAAQATAKNAA
jgi:small subunit ribosomal protein S11